MYPYTHIFNMTVHLLCSYAIPYYSLRYLTIFAPFWQVYSLLNLHYVCPNYEDTFLLFLYYFLFILKYFFLEVTNVEKYVH